MTKITFSEDLNKQKPFSAGNYFLVPSPDKQIYILSQPAFNKVCLTSLITGNRWDEMVEVECSSNISENEMLQITDGKSYTRVSVEISVSKYV